MGLTEHIDILSSLFKQWADNETISAIYPLPISGSQRQYFRIEAGKKTAIGCFNEDITENEAFFHFTEQFHKANLPVPEIYSIHRNKQYYILQDLGNKTLFTLLSETKDFNSEILPLYKTSILQLIQFQTKGKDLINFSKAYPRETFDSQSILWDLSYFKYYWIKFLELPFNEQLLENDFHSFTNYLTKIPHHYFLFRDFQSRNIMVHNNNLFFIDYQGGRKGALYYDLASLLYDSKANLSTATREELLNFYITNIKKLIPSTNSETFKNEFYSYAMIRVLQAFGAYGFRGIHEQKIHFLKSIPFAINNLSEILEKGHFTFSASHLFEVLTSMIESRQWEKFAVYETNETKLHIHITSFSYRKQLPSDVSGNGGGFVFDCRTLPNPGHIDMYKSLTGQELPVIKYLAPQPAVKNYLENVISLVDSSIDNYLERNFTNLMVNFGCTGGQHRSVYCAEQLYLHLRKKYGNKIKITLFHTELKKSKTHSLTINSKNN